MPKPTRPTQADVARLAGVSTATVSYVASGRAGREQPASGETQERVLAAMEELGYRPQWAAQALRRQRSGLLTVLTYSPLNPWAEDLLTQVQERAAARGLETVILRYTSAEHLLGQVKLIRGGFGDAVMVLGFEDMVEANQSALAQLPVPVMAVANEGPPELSYLRQREGGAIHALLRHLRDGGATEIQYVSEGDAPWQASVARRAVWVLEAAEECGFETPRIHHLARRSPTRDEAVALLRGIRPDGTTTLLCASDRAAICLLWAAVDLGVAVPGDVRITGMGNIEDGRLAVPALTTVGVDRPDYRDAIDRFLDRIDEPGVPAQSLDVPWHLVRRDSA